MTAPTEASPAEAAPDAGSRWRHGVLRFVRPGRGRWAWATPAIAAVSGALFAISASSSQGTDLRPGRYTDVASLVQAEARSYQQLQSRVTRLSAEVDALTTTVDSPAVSRIQQRAAALQGPAGLDPVRGPGLTITLSDSPISLADSTDVPLNLLLVHQQDVQAVVNALWRGGAQAVTIQGQRVISTTAIKCEGNSITIQGVPYPQPYRISAVGDPTALEASVESDSYLQLYVAQSQRPDIRIGWSMTPETEVSAPAYDGLLDLAYATPTS